MYKAHIKHRCSSPIVISSLFVPNATANKRRRIISRRLKKTDLGLRSGVSNVLTNKIVPSGDHDVPLPAVAHTLQDLPHAQGNSGLTRAWGAGEAHVERWHGRIEAKLTTHL